MKQACQHTLNGVRETFDHATQNSFWLYKKQKEQ